MRCAQHFTGTTAASRACALPTLLQLLPELSLTQPRLDQGVPCGFSETVVFPKFIQILDQRIVRSTRLASATSRLQLGRATRLIRLCVGPIEKLLPLGFEDGSRSRMSAS